MEINWKTDEKQGYVDGMVLFYGTFKKGIGGGLCQLSNLIYWATLHTPLTVTERYRHSFDVFPDSRRTQPFGSGATCSYNYLDLQIKNETSEPYQLHLFLTDSHLVGEWRTTTEPYILIKYMKKIMPSRPHTGEVPVATTRFIEKNTTDKNSKLRTNIRSGKSRHYDV